MNVTIDDDVMFRNATLTACPLKNNESILHCPSGSQLIWTDFNLVFANFLANYWITLPRKLYNTKIN